MHSTASPVGIDCIPLIVTLDAWVLSNAVVRSIMALTRLPCCPQEIHQEGEAKKEIRL
jgi:hypothetical protein